MTSTSETNDGQSSEIKYPKLPPRTFASIDAETYIRERFNDSISWYDSKAVTSKSRYQWMKATTVIGGAMVPVLVNISYPYVTIVTTVISIGVVLLVSLESVFHFREQWVNYRSTEQYLRREYFQFTSREGVYSNEDEPAAFRIFVERVEGKIEAENASTLQVLTTVSEAPGKQPSVSETSD